MGTTISFQTWEDVWMDPTITSCEATQHGTTVSVLQNFAVNLALEAYSGDRDQALIGLHVQCAITSNGYLSIERLSGNQVVEVEGMLALCPDRPGADTLRNALPSR